MGARPDDELPPIVEVRPDASRASLVLEIRTSDRPGVVHRVLTTLAGLGLTVASAHVSTLGPQAVDVFYVQEQDAGALTDEKLTKEAWEGRVEGIADTPGVLLLRLPRVAKSATVDGGPLEIKTDEEQKLTWVRFNNTARPRHIEVKF